MPRIFRILPEEGALHLLTRGNNRQRIFEDESDYNNYLGFVKLYKKENKISVYHYCLMPNHVHLIVEITPESNLAKFMKQLNLAYLYYYKKKYSYDGHLWQGRYKSILISKDEYLIACGRYIESNPVKAKLAKNISNYPWSSYNVYAYGKKDEIVDYDPIYLESGRTKKERQRYYIEDTNGYISEIDLNARFLGSADYIGKMESQFKVANVRGKRGRPVKLNK